MDAICNATLPQAHADSCDHNASPGEVNMVMWTRNDVGDKLSAVTSVAINARLSNTTALPALGTAAPIRYLYVIGELPAGSTDSTDLPLGQKYYFASDNTLNFKCFDMSVENHALYVECENLGGIQYQAWFRDEGGKFFGGIDGGKAGVSVTLTMKLVIPTSKKELKHYACSMTFNGPVTTMIDSPI